MPPPLRLRLCVEAHLWPIALALLALSLGRPYLGMHYPSDVAVGSVLGVILGLLVPLSI